MRAVQCVEWGPPEKLVVADVEVPEPKPGEVRVRVAAAGDEGGPTGMVGQKRNHAVDEEVGALLVADAAEAADVTEGRVEAACALGFRFVIRGTKDVAVDTVHDDGAWHFEIACSSCTRRDHGVHLADQEFRPSGMLALRSGGEDKLQGHAQDVAQRDTGRQAQAKPALLKLSLISPGVQEIRVQMENEPLTAEDYVFALQRAATSGYDFAWYWDFAGGIKGWKEVTEGTADVSTLGLKAVDDLTIEVTTVAPKPYLPGVVSLWYPVPKHVWDKSGDEYAANVETMVSSGPFLLETWEKSNNKMTFVKNPKYTGPWQPQADRLVIDPSLGAPEVGA